jgi:putative PIN family toxin of toxin-antitoxin system
VIRAVIDTNVLVSGLLASAGNEAPIILAINQGLVHPCFSDDILEEYSEVLARPKFAFDADEIAALLAMLRGNGELIRRFGTRLARSRRQHVSALRSGCRGGVYPHRQQGHFPQNICGTVRVISAGELLDRITREI